MTILDKKLIVLSLLLIFMSLLCFIVWYDYWYITSYYKMEPVSYQHIVLNIPDYKITYTKNELKEEISKLYNISHCYEEIDNLEPTTTGTTKLLLRKVYIRKNLSLQSYATTYAHELTHIKYNTANETYTNYMSLIILYESENIQLQQIALNEMKAIIKGRESGTVYDCGYYLLNYLKEKGEVI